MTDTFVPPEAHTQHNGGDATKLVILTYTRNQGLWITPSYSFKEIWYRDPRNGYVYITSKKFSNYQRAVEVDGKFLMEIPCDLEHDRKYSRYALEHGSNIWAVPIQE